MPARLPETRRALANRQRQAWHMRAVRKLEVSEIAELIGISEVMIKRDPGCEWAPRRGADTPEGGCAT